jgi:CxxC motif-containing protein (DUF1111 family)
MLAKCFLTPWRGCAALLLTYAQLRTGDFPLLPIIANTAFRAFTDLLLHDMGEDLADGRARNVLEAILWHGGEAKAAKDAFSQMSASQRDDLRAVVNAL